MRGDRHDITQTLASKQISIINVLDLIIIGSEAFLLAKLHLHGELEHTALFDAFRCNLQNALICLNKRLGNHKA